MHNAPTMTPGRTHDSLDFTNAGGLAPGSQIIIRWAGPPLPDRLEVAGGETVARIWKDYVASCPHFDPSKECFAVIGVNTRLHFVGWHLVGIGTAHDCLVSPLDVFKSLFAMGADGFIAVHNHPSGVVLPSRPDEDVTRRLSELAIPLGMRFHDHVIVDSEGLAYLSLRETNIHDLFSVMPIPKRGTRPVAAETIECIDAGVRVEISIPRVFIRGIGVKGIQNALFNMISNPLDLPAMSSRGSRRFRRTLKQAESYKLRSTHELIIPAVGWTKIMDLARTFEITPDAYVLGLCAMVSHEGRSEMPAGSMPSNVVGFTC